MIQTYSARSMSENSTLNVKIILPQTNASEVTKSFILQRDYSDFYVGTI